MTVILECVEKRIAKIYFAQHILKMRSRISCPTACHNHNPQYPPADFGYFPRKIPGGGGEDTRLALEWFPHAASH